LRLEGDASGAQIRGLDADSSNAPALKCVPR
jgi:hypothetical protein